MERERFIKLSIDERARERIISLIGVDYDGLYCEPTPQEQARKKYQWHYRQWLRDWHSVCPQNNKNERHREMEKLRHETKD